MRETSKDHINGITTSYVLYKIPTLLTQLHATQNPTLSLQAKLRLHARGRA
jgi:hypothetical protein